MTICKHKDCSNCIYILEQQLNLLNAENELIFKAFEDSYNLIIELKAQINLLKGAKHEKKKNFKKNI